jgi:hypothetical protein
MGADHHRLPSKLPFQIIEAAQRVGDRSWAFTARCAAGFKQLAGAVESAADPLPPEMPTHFYPGPSSRTQ